MGKFSGLVNNPSNNNSDRLSVPVLHSYSNNKSSFHSYQLSALDYMQHGSENSLDVT